MGKPYARELEALPATYDWAKSTPIDRLSEFVRDSVNTPLYVIGSGGSFTAAAFASMLHQHAGLIAKCVTPLEFLGYENVGRGCSILLVTARGNNPDIISSFDRAVRLRPENLGVVCASTGGRLARMAPGDGVSIHAADPPAGRDGFLATNTLLATLVWLCRAYIAARSMPYEIPPLDLLVLGNKTRQDFEGMMNSKLECLRDSETLVCLHDNWGKTAAIDAESKLIEAGLANVQLCDYRSFAHGRHNWLDKHRGKTGLVSLVTPQCERLASKTLDLVPGYVPVASLATRHDGPIASLALFIQVLHLVRFFGVIRGIDPGRPGVAAFGEELYNMSVPPESGHADTAGNRGYRS